MPDPAPLPTMPAPGITTLAPALPPACLTAAEIATDRFCAVEPDLVARYGERGGAYSRHDFAYLFAWAVDAQALDEPATFDRNVLWLADVLSARDFPFAWYLASCGSRGTWRWRRGC